MAYNTPRVRRSPPERKVRPVRAVQSILSAFARGTACVSCAYTCVYAYDTRVYLFLTRVYLCVILGPVHRVRLVPPRSAYIAETGNGHVSGHGHVSGTWNHQGRLSWSYCSGSILKYQYPPPSASSTLPPCAPSASLSPGKRQQRPEHGPSPTNHAPRCYVTSPCHVSLSRLCHMSPSRSPCLRIRAASTDAGAAEHAPATPRGPQPCLIGMPYRHAAYIIGSHAL
jgi:hypothetical protein